MEHGRRFVMRRGFLVAGTVLLAQWSSAEFAIAGGGGGGICLADSLAPTSGTVFVSDNCFYRPEVTVRAGEVVRWEVRAAGVPHTVTFDMGLDSGDVEGPFAVRFNSPGTYEYFCRYHGGVGYGMAGSVIVEGKARGEPSLEMVEGGLGGSADGPELSTTPITAVRPAATEPSQVVALLRLDPPTVAVVLGAALAFGLGIGAGLGLFGRLGRRRG
jgi:plastocyanin